MLAVKQSHGEWPASWAEPITRLIQASSRFSRPDGTPATEFERPAGSAKDRSIFRSRAENGHVPGPRRKGGGAELGGRSAPNETNNGTGNHQPRGSGRRVLAAMRPDGLAANEFLVVDHRDGGTACRIELFGAGCSWLGPAWTLDCEPVGTSTPRPQTRISDAAAELVEWSYSAGESRITRSALLLRGHRLALLSILVESRSPLPEDLSLRMRVSLAPTIASAPVPGRRAILLSGAKQHGSLLVLPIGLPCLDYATERGKFEVLDRTLTVSQAPRDRRALVAPPGFVGLAAQPKKRALARADGVRKNPDSEIRPGARSRA